MQSVDVYLEHLWNNLLICICWMSWVKVRRLHFFVLKEALCCLNAGGKKLDWNGKTAMAGSQLRKVLCYNNPKTSDLCTQVWFKAQWNYHHPSYFTRWKDTRSMNGCGAAVSVTRLYTVGYNLNKSFGFGETTLFSTVFKITYNGRSHHLPAIGYRW